MKRTPQVRALWNGKNRRTTIQILAGTLLTFPAGIAHMRRADDIRPTTAPIVVAPVEVVAKRSFTTAAIFAREFKIPTSLAQDIHKAAVEVGISPHVAFGLVRAESSFRPAAISPVGAIGLTQLMPATARWLQPGISRQQLKNPETNLRIGFKYLKQLIEKYDGNEKLALTAFNRGPGTVDKLLKRGGNPDNGYAEKVLTGRSRKHVDLMNAKFRRRS